MSKQIKQLQMDALSKTFDGVRDLVLLSSTGLNSQADNKIRLDLRKKSIHMHVVKNSLARRVFDKLGLKLTTPWEGPTLVAWGTSSIAELSKEIAGFMKKHEKNFKVKTAVVDGQEIPFDLALKMPTRTEAIGRVVAQAMAPASRLVSQILGPASQVASQIKSITDRKEEPAPAPAG
jgi:ribosomal protein L10